MKAVRAIDEPPRGLADYLCLVGDEAYWDEFRSHDSGTAYRELVEAWTSNQHGLCAYCETSISAQRRQVEHVVPRSEKARGRALELDISNLVACCLGVGGPRRGRTGPVPAANEPRRSRGSNESCGQAKAAQWWGGFLDPRELPPALAILKVREDGFIQPDDKACSATGLMAEDARRSIETLNLNANRLRHARRRLWDDLVEVSADVLNEPGMTTWVRTVLTPDERGRLAPFFTTSRSYFGPAGERILARQPQEWI